MVDIYAMCEWMNIYYGVILENLAGFTTLLLVVISHSVSSF